jgi:anti-anti-sigma factor
MEIELRKDGDTVAIVIDGNIDTDGGERLSKALHSVMGMADVKNVAFNMCAVRTITSSGIGKLMNFFKYIDDKKGSMCIKGVSDTLYAQFMEIHLDRIFSISRA